MTILLAQGREWAAKDGTTADSLDPRPRPELGEDHLSLSVADCRAMIEFDREVVQCVLQGPFDVSLIAAADQERRQHIAMLAATLAERDDAREKSIQGKDDYDFAFTLRSHEADFYSSFAFLSSSANGVAHHGAHNKKPKPLATILLDKQNGAAQQIRDYLHVQLKHLLRTFSTEGEIQPYRLLILGHQAIKDNAASAWNVGNTLLNAQLYNEQVVGRSNFTPTEPAQTMNSLMRMTSRQSGRSGVSEDDLRARYGTAGDEANEVQTDSDSDC